MWACIINTGIFKYATATYKLEDLMEHVKHLGYEFSDLEEIKEKYDDWRESKFKRDSDACGIR